MNYGYSWIEYTVIPLDNSWALAVGIIEDNQYKSRKVRVAKGMLRGEWKRRKGKLVAVLRDKKEPITQINRVTFRDKEEWTSVKTLTDKFIKQLEKTK